MEQKFSLQTEIETVSFRIRLRISAFVYSSCVNQVLAMQSRIQDFVHGRVRLQHTSPVRNLSTPR